MTSQKAHSRTVRLETYEGQFVIGDLSDAKLGADVGDGMGLFMYDLPESKWLHILTGLSLGPVEVEVRVHQSEPPVSDLWEEIAEISVWCRSGLEVLELLGEPRMTIVDRGGEYRLRLSARGRDAGRRRDSAGSRSKIIEHYLVELWSAPAGAPIAWRLAHRDDAPPPVVEAEHSGRVAAWRLHTDLTRAVGHREISAVDGTVEIQYVYLAPRSKLFRDFARFSEWLTGMSASGVLGKLAVGTAYRCSSFADPRDNDFEPILGGGDIRGEFITLNRPRLVEVSWNWWLSGRPFLPSETRLSFELVEVKESSQSPGATRVTLKHGGLPKEWVPDMTAYWTWKMEEGDKVYRLGID